jgi:hypothetical protein
LSSDLRFFSCSRWRLAKVFWFLLRAMVISF